MRFEYSPAALDDLQNIQRYHLEQAGVTLAASLMARIHSTVERLIARNPHVGRLRPELGSGIRSFPVLPYVVFYRVAGRSVLVQRILHGHRDIRRPLASLLAAV
jgi:toxin ParE1/3/4